MVFVALVALLPLSALADDWTAIKLRGHVLQLVDGQWEPLARGDIVPDNRVIRTLRDGRVEFQRDNETISLAADTQIQISDRSGRKFTTVTQYFGVVEVEADVREVQHFAVETPYLVAVVKGTRFVVRSGDRGAEVKVHRGLVEVTGSEDGLVANIPAGQTARVGTDGGFAVTGPGANKTNILGADGIAVAAAKAASPSPSVGGPGTIPGQDPDFTPPGQDPDFTPPGRDQTFVPPSRMP